jgi:LuxR family maltose regulon positive regulatory protein
MTQPEQVSTLHHRASQWYEQNCYVDEAIEHVFSAQDYEQAAHLIYERIDILWGRWENIKLRHWLNILPKEVLSAKPYINIFQARLQYLYGELDAAERTLHVMKQAIDSISIDDTARDKLRGRTAVVWAGLYNYQADVPKIIHYAHQALRDLPSENFSWRGMVAIFLGNAHDFSGHTAEAYKARLEAQNAFKAAGDFYNVLFAGHQMAITLRAQGWLQQTIELCEQQ